MVTPNIYVKFFLINKPKKKILEVAVVYAKIYALLVYVTSQSYLLFEIVVIIVDCHEDRAKTEDLTSVWTA